MPGLHKQLNCFKSHTKSINQVIVRGTFKYKFFFKNTCKTITPVEHSLKFILRVDYSILAHEFRLSTKACVRLSFYRQCTAVLPSQPLYLLSNQLTASVRFYCDLSEAPLIS